MSVATQLGLDDPDRGLLAAARRAWRGWARQHEALGVVAELEDLPAWLTAHPGERSTVLGVLSGLAAQQEGDDVPAAAALAWLLVPGRACWRTGWPRSPRTSMNWSPPSCGSRCGPSGPAGAAVAATILRNTRKGVLRDLGVGDHADSAWQRRVVLDPEF